MAEDISAHSLPPPPAVSAAKRSAWPAALQNVCALGATVALTLHGDISGNVAAGMILAVVGVVTLPAVASRFGQKGVGSIGVFSLLAKPALVAATLLTRI